MLNGTKLIFYFRNQRASEDLLSTLVLFLMPFYGYYEAVRVGAICLLTMGIGTVFITNSIFGESSLIEIDSTFCKVHQSACSALKNQDIGSSRGGKNTKIHVLVNERMQMINVALTEPSVQSKFVIILKKKVEMYKKHF